MRTLILNESEIEHMANRLYSKDPMEFHPPDLPDRLRQDPRKFVRWFMTELNSRPTRTAKQ